jgi:TRAP-type C4-dicarboxylate transport system permease small subunit
MRKKRNSWFIFDLLIDTFAVIAGFAVLLVTLLVSYSVILRYLHFTPPIWILQFTEYALLWITFLAAAWLLKHEGHIRIDTFVILFGPKGRKIWEVICAAIGFAVCLTVFWFGTKVTLDYHARGIMDIQSVSLPMYPLFVIIPFGSLMLLIQFLRNIVEAFLVPLEKEGH